MQADKEKVGLILRTARGQIDGILKMIDDDRYCIDISNQIVAVQAQLRKANKEVLGAHMKCCVKDAMQEDESKAEEKIEELIGLIDNLMK